MNAIQFLLNQHNQVRETFSEIEKQASSDVTRKKLLSQLCHDLLVHEKNEQTILYPHFDNHPQLQEIIKHLCKEEADAEKLIKEFEKPATKDEQQKIFLKLKEDVEHHAKDEEKKLFPVIQTLLSESKLEDIGKKMLEFKKENDGALSNQVNIKMPRERCQNHNHDDSNSIFQKLKCLVKDIFK